MELPIYVKKPYPEVFQRRYPLRRKVKEKAMEVDCNLCLEIGQDCDCLKCLTEIYNREYQETTPVATATPPATTAAAPPAPTPDNYVAEAAPPPEPEVQTPEEVPEVISPPEPDVRTPEKVPDPKQWRPEGHHKECTCGTCLTALGNALTHWLTPASASPSQETPMKTTTVGVPQTSTPTPRTDIPPLDPDISEEPPVPPNVEASTGSQTSNSAALHEDDCNCTRCLSHLLQEVTENPPAPVQPAQVQLPKFKLPATTDTPTYAAVTAMAAATPALNFTKRPNLQGDIIITPKDQATATLLYKEATLTFLDPSKKQKKAVVFNYPPSLPVSLIEECQNVAQAKRRLGRGKAPTKEVNVTFIGPIPPDLDLGPWGTFPIKALEKEPLRCFNCQRFGHHKTHCQSRTVCGVCSGSHPTQTCIDAHNNGGYTQAKCPNCSKNQHAWNKRCPEFLRRLQPQQDSNPTDGPPPTAEPKPQRKPRRRPPRKPAHTSAPAVNQEPTVTASPAEEPPADTVQLPPHPPVISSILAQAEALPIDTLIPLVLQLVVKVCSLAQTPPSVIQSLLNPLVTPSLGQG
ncbi:proteoglycan 4-like [Palaemon carinicauda]|uniref:proteoglycan 4-like n=1 Tax=Palaemon carinicauda TaxID=392227 RepID=UPI0035B5C084